MSDTKVSFSSSKLGEPSRLALAALALLFAGYITDPEIVIAGTVTIVTLSEAFLYVGTAVALVLAFQYAFYAAMLVGGLTLAVFLFVMGVAIRIVRIALKRTEV